MSNQVQDFDQVFNANQQALDELDLAAKDLPSSPTGCAYSLLFLKAEGVLMDSRKNKGQKNAVTKVRFRVLDGELKGQEFVRFYNSEYMFTYAEFFNFVTMVSRNPAPAIAKSASAGIEALTPYNGRAVVRCIATLGETKDKRPVTNYRFPEVTDVLQA